MSHLPLSPIALVPYGYVKKTHGHKGALVITLESEQLLDLSPDFIFIQVEGIPVPFEMESMNGTRDHCIVTFSRISTLAEAEKYRGARLYVAEAESQAQFANSNEEELPLSLLIGYTLYHPIVGEVGTLVHIDDSTDNILLSITTTDGSELMLPYVDEWIVGYDPDERTLLMDFPTALLSLN